MANEKLIAGAVMILLNLVVLAPIATSMVEDAVEDNFETHPYDSACEDSDCTTAEEDWATSTSERTYYAWNLTNADAVMAGGDPVYDKVGPFLYDITTTRNIIEFNESAGTLTYNESKVFECSADTLNPCDMPITQLNIPFQPQVVGATGTAINGIMDLTKAGFTAGMLAKDLESLFAGSPTGAAMISNLDYTAAVLEMDFGMDSETATAAAPGVLADNFWSQYDAAFEPSAGYPYATVFGLGADFAANFTDANMGYAFYDAMGPGGEDLSLTGSLGPTMLAGHCSAFPTNPTDHLDVANASIRASIWQYTGADDATTVARDWAMCAGVGLTFATLGGGDSAWMFDTTGISVDASTRLAHLGITMDNAAAMLLLFGTPGDEVITGLLEVSEDGTEFGVANFLGMGTDAMSAYGLDPATYGAVATWAGSWMADASSLPMILLGGSRNMNAKMFVNTSFGAEDPLNGGYLDNSLNLGGAWGTALIAASEGAPSIALDAAVSGNVLYGPLGLTTAAGATVFLYGELTGKTPPVNFATGEPAPEMDWNTDTIQAFYPGVDANAANALRVLMTSVIYGDFVPGFLVDTFGSSGQYMTMPLDNWLYGWRDPVSAFVAGDVTDPSLGWSKLETNETYFGSGGISTGPASVYVMCTGHNSDCDKGEAISEDGSNQLSWRNDMMFAETYGLVTPVNLNETTGGFLTGSGDMVNAGGYAVTEVVCDGTGEVKGIPVDECTASVDPTTNPITAKLIKSFTLLDATTPALPVYFGSEISMMSEDISGIIISGSSTSTFYLDTRTGLDMATAPNMTDLQPVFQIEQSSEIEDDDAEDMESAIVQNQEYMGWWMNFDTGFDYVALLLYIGGVALVIMHFVMAGKDEDKDYS